MSIESILSTSSGVASTAHVDHDARLMKLHERHGFDVYADPPR